MIRIDTQYIPHKGILVGTFSESDILNGIDKEKTKEIQEKFKLNYTNTEFVKQSRHITGVKIYACHLIDCQDF